MKTTYYKTITGKKSWLPILNDDYYKNEYKKYTKSGGKVSYEEFYKVKSKSKVSLKQYKIDYNKGLLLGLSASNKTKQEINKMYNKLKVKI